MRHITIAVPLALCLGATAFLPAAWAADSQGPKGPVQITVGSGPGGSVDLLTRRIAKIMNEEKIVEQPLVIDNRPGGSWSVATNYVIGKKGDPNTLYTLTQVMLTAPILQGEGNAYEKLSPIAVFVEADMVLAVQPDSPLNNLTDVVKQSKEHPRSVKVAGSNVGSTDSMAIGIIEKATGIRMNYIAFANSGSLSAFLGRNVDMIVVNPDDGLELAKSGKAKLITILSKQRRTEPGLTDIPTAREQGVDVVWVQQWGLAGPPDLDPALVKWWDSKIGELVKSPAWQTALDETFMRSSYVHGAALKPFLDDYYSRHLAALKQLGVVKD